MNKKVVIGFIAIMSLSLLGIIGLQVYWILNAIDVKEERFNQDVSDAILIVSKKIESDEIVDRIHQNFSFKSKDALGLSSEDLQKYLDSLFLNKEIDGSFFNGQSGEELFMQSFGNGLNTNRGKQSIRVNITTDSTIRTTVSGINFNKELLINSNNAFAFTPDDSTQQVLIEKVEERYNQVGGVFTDFFIESMETNKPLEERVNKEEIDSLVTAELENRGIKLKPEFGVTQMGILTKIKSANFNPDDNAFKTQLFQGAIVPRLEHLLVTFPTKQSYIVKSLWWMLGLSALFTLTIIITYYRTVYYMLKQKRISDIKTDFINNMTHEFKTPIATISLAVDSINNPKIIEDKERVKHYTTIISQENKRMNAQVENVLRMALLDKKEFKIKPELMDAHDLVNKAIGHIELPVESRGGTIHKELSAIETDVNVDPIHFGNVLTNILDNANKYSVDKPEITVKTSNRDGQFIVTIADKGMGMGKEVQKRIFDRFYREHTGNIHNIKGHGLGLSYVKEMIDAHNATISVSSEKGKGSIFEIAIPLNSFVDDKE